MKFKHSGSKDLHVCVENKEFTHHLKTGHLMDIRSLSLVLDIKVGIVRLYSLEYTRGLCVTSLDPGQTAHKSYPLSTGVKFNVVHFLSLSLSYCGPLNYVQTVDYFVKFW